MPAQSGRQDELRAVESFWTDHPLCAFEAPYAPGSAEFFAWHDRVRWHEEGRFTEHLYEFDRHARERVLDVGCGVGWLVTRFARAGAIVTGVDISATAVQLTRQRLASEGLVADICQANAEALPFPDRSFDFVTSAGVLHHTPDTVKAVSEIHRVLRPGGRAMISLYYRNVLLRRCCWSLTRLLVRHIIGALPGRAKFRHVDTVEELARLYDGDGNPVGKIYTKPEARSLFQAFQIEAMETHYFPSRFLPIRLPDAGHRLIDGVLGLMIYARLRRPAATAS